MSDASNNKLRVKHYKSTTNTEGKNYTKSKRCIKRGKLNIDSCGCYKKTFCYSVDRKMHNRTCLIDHVKEMKRSRRRKRSRRNAV